MFIGIGKYVSFKPLLLSGIISAFFVLSCSLVPFTSYAGIELVLHVMNENFGNGAKTFDEFQNEAEIFYNALGSLSKYSKHSFFPAPVAFSKMNKYQSGWEYKTYAFSDVEVIFSAVLMNGKMSGVVKGVERTFFDLKNEKKQFTEVVLNLPEVNDMREIKSLHFSMKAVASRFPERSTSSVAAVLASTFRAPVYSMPAMALYSDATRTDRIHVAGLVRYKAHTSANNPYENTVLELNLLTQGDYNLNEISELKNLIEIKNR